LIIGGERRPDIDYDGIPAGDADRRIVVTGRLSDAEVSALMRRSDLFVFPTLADTLPLVVFEAMAHGLPVLASAVGGIPYQIDSDCGALVPPNDPMALAAEISRLDSDPARLRAMGLNARIRAVTLAAWPAVARQTADIYRRIVAGANRAPAPVVSTEPVVIRAANRRKA
jgi:glycosyltransferase involved in cell wall biosynthesis